MSTRTLIGLFLAATAGIVIFLFVSLSSDPQKGGAPVITVGTKSAAAACTPDGGTDCLPNVQFIDTNGKVYSRTELLGKVVVVNFWATWCGPCKHEIPEFSQVATRYKGKDVVMLGVMVDNPDAQSLLDFSTDFKITYPIVRSDRVVLEAFQDPPNIPTTFVYDRSGKQRDHQVGPMSERDLSSKLDALLAER